MLEVTILTVTHRDQYIQEQYEALKSQVYKDFEWLIIDDNYEQTKDIYAQFKEMQIRHYKSPVVNPYFSKTSCTNFGLTLAKGRLIYYMNDYVIPHPSCLERHVGIQNRFGGCMLTGRRISVGKVPGNMDDEFKGQDGYLHILNEGLYHTIRLNHIDSSLREVFGLGVNIHQDGRNDSCPLAAIVAVNGFDEIFDGYYGGEDYDMAVRLSNFGLRCIYDEQARSFELPHISNQKPSKKLGFNADTEIRRRFKEKVIISSNSWSLAIQRKMNENYS